MADRTSDVIPKEMDECLFSNGVVFSALDSLLAAYACLLTGRKVSEVVGHVPVTVA